MWCCDDFIVNTSFVAGLQLADGLPSVMRLRGIIIIYVVQFVQFATQGAEPLDVQCIGGCKLIRADRKTLLAVCC